MIGVLHIVLPFINGGLFDAWEYYSCLKRSKTTKDVGLYLLYQAGFYDSQTGIFLDKLIPIFKDKYKDIDDLLKGIHVIKPYGAINKFRFDSVLFTDNHTPEHLFGRVISKKYFFTIEPYYPTRTRYDKLVKLPNIHIYNETLLWK